LASSRLVNSYYDINRLLNRGSESWQQREIPMNRFNLLSSRKPSVSSYQGELMWKGEGLLYMSLQLVNGMELRWCEWVG
jgi:hypothetical protein